MNGVVAILRIFSVTEAVLPSLGSLWRMAQGSARGAARRLAAACEAWGQRVRVRTLDEHVDVNAEVERLERGLRRIGRKTAGDRVRVAARS
jgi:hypothetical protein